MILLCESEQKTDVSEMKFKTETLNYAHASFTVNHALMRRQPESRVGTADSTTNDENFGTSK